jgi:hypothetical protein
MLVAVYFYLVRFSFPKGVSKALLLLLGQFQGMIQLVLVGIDSLEARGFVDNLLHIFNGKFHWKDGIAIFRGGTVVDIVICTAEKMLGSIPMNDSAHFRLSSMERFCD